MPEAASAIISFIRKASLCLCPSCLPRSVALSLKKVKPNWVPKMDTRPPVAAVTLDLEKKSAEAHDRLYAHGLQMIGFVLNA